MSEERTLRAAVAEALGWARIQKWPHRRQTSAPEFVGHHPNVYEDAYNFPSPDGADEWLAPIPAYDANLNAAAEMEAIGLETPEERGEYISQLISICGRAWYHMATAEQRCLAFLKAKGKEWTA